MAHSAVVFIEPADRFLQKIQAGGAGKSGTWVPLVLEYDPQQVKSGLERTNVSAVFVYGKELTRALYLNLQSILKEKPTLPIYFVASEVLAEEQSLRDMGFRRVFQEQDVTWELIDTIIQEGIHPFEQRDILEQSKVLEAFGKKTRELLDEDVIAIRAEDFMSGSTSLFDVYVRLSQDKYLKLVHAGDLFTPDRVDEYLDKGVKSFHIRLSAHQAYLTYCDQLARAILNRRDLPLELKTKQVMNLGEQILGRVQQLGVDDESIDYAKKFLRGTGALISSLSAPGGSTLHDFLENTTQYEHAVSCTVICALIAQKLEIQMERPTQIVGLSAFFHDCGLSQLPARLQVDSPRDVSAPDLPLYETHPELSAAMLKESNQTDPAVIQAITQHHQRAKGGGFPKGATSQLTRVAEIVGVADEFDQLLKKYGTADRDLLQDVCEAALLPQFSKQIAYAFRSALFPRKAKS